MERHHDDNNNLRIITFNHNGRKDVYHHMPSASIPNSLTTSYTTKTTVVYHPQPKTGNSPSQSNLRPLFQRIPHTLLPPDAPISCNRYIV